MSVLLVLFLPQLWASAVPSWVQGHVPRADGFHYYIGRGFSLIDDKHAHREAMQDATERLLRERYGFVSSVEVSAESSLAGVGLKKRHSERIVEQRVEGFEEVDAFFQAGGVGTSAWVLYRVASLGPAPVLDLVAAEPSRADRSLPDVFFSLGVHWAQEVGPSVSMMARLAPVMALEVGYRFGGSGLSQQHGFRLSAAWLFLQGQFFHLYAALDAELLLNLGGLGYTRDGERRLDWRRKASLGASIGIRRWWGQTQRAGLGIRGGAAQNRAWGVVECAFVL